MPGRRINDQQKVLFMSLRRKHPTPLAAAKSGFSPATGYRIVARRHSPPEEKARRGRPRSSALLAIFDEVAVPKLEAAPGLLAVTIYEEVMRAHPDLDPGCRRTIERWVGKWKALHGRDREVIFRQVHEPGRMAQSDFTDASELGVTIAGERLKHRLYHFRLPYSGFQHAHVVLGGESLSALSEGLQDALWLLGGVPREHRTDSMSAAYKNRRRSVRDDFTQGYETLCADYGMEPTRNNRGVAHENGSIESAHGHLKRKIREALELRASRDFEALEDYRRFIAEIVGRHNARHRQAIKEERKRLKPLPARRTADYEEKLVTVASTGGFTYRKAFYTVCSRLIGRHLRVRIYDDRLELYLGGSHLDTLARARPGERFVVDYRHVIRSLRQKPGALAGSVYRDELFPRPIFRDMYAFLIEEKGEHVACRTLVELLELAFDRCCEAELAARLEEDLRRKRAPDPAALRLLFGPSEGTFPDVAVEKADLASFDRLTSGGARIEEVAA